MRHIARSQPSCSYAEKPTLPQLAKYFLTIVSETALGMPPTYILGPAPCGRLDREALLLSGRVGAVPDQSVPLAPAQACSKFFKNGRNVFMTLQKFWYCSAYGCQHPMQSPECESHSQNSRLRYSTNHNRYARTLHLNL